MFLQQLLSRASATPATCSATVVCGSGYRSTVAARLLLRAGREDVSNLSGGMTAYRVAGHRLATDQPSTIQQEIPA